MKVSELIERFSNIKQCGAMFIVVTPYNIAVYDITKYDGIEPSEVTRIDVLNNPGVNTWREVEDIVFGEPTAPNFSRVFNA